MKRKSNPFVTISDLMAGVTAVVMLFLVTAVINFFYVNEKQKAITYEKEQKIEKLEKAKRDRVKEALIKINDELEKLPERNLVLVDTINDKILLNDGSFNSGSACIAPRIRTVLQDVVAQILVPVLQDTNLNVGVQFEGHTDPQKLSGTTNSCGAFDDNYSLSSVRAREVRKVVLHAVKDDENINRKVLVSGFGPDRLEDKKDLISPRNRRVEIRLVLDKENNKGEI